MIKRYLLKYETSEFNVLSYDFHYVLHLEVVWFYGLFKTHKKVNYIVYEHQSLSDHHEHWNDLIINKTSF